MHVNWGFWAALLGVATLGEVMNDRTERGDELAKTLILLVGQGEDGEFRRVLGQYRFGGSMDQAYVSAYDACTQLQAIKEGRSRDSSHVQRFREWCRSLV